MRVKVEDVVLMEPVAKKLLSYEWETPVKSYNVFKVINGVLEQNKFFLTEKSKLFKKYGVTEGEYIKIKPQNEKKYKEEVEKLLEVEVEIPDIEFVLDDVFKAGYIESTDVESKCEKLTPLDMYRIETFLNRIQEYSIALATQDK